MRLQRLTDYLLHHRWQAMILAFLITYIPVLGMTSILIAGLFTLCVGVFEGAVFTLAVTLPYVIVMMYGTQESLPIAVTWATVVLTVTGNFLTWAFAVLLRRNWSWSKILQIAALLGVLVISVIHLAYPGIADWWASQLTQSANMTGMATAGGLESAGETKLETINVIKSFATGIITAFVLLAAVVQVIVSRWWQVTVVNHSQLGKELLYVHLSHLAGILFIFSIVFYYLENRVVLDILPVLCLLFSAAGLSLVHYLCGLMEPSKGHFWLSILYVALMYSLTMMAMLPLFLKLNMMMPVVIAVLILTAGIFAFVILGLVDVWFDIRKRFKKG